MEGARGSVNIPYSSRIWPTAVVGVADSVTSVSASACHIVGPNSVNPGQILLVYGTANKGGGSKTPDFLLTLFIHGPQQVKKGLKKHYINRSLLSSPFQSGV